MQFSSHEMATQKIFFLTFLHFAAFRPELLILHAQCPSIIKNALKATHAYNYVRSIEQVIVVPLSFGENRAFLVLFIFSVNIYKTCALFLGHSGCILFEFRSWHKLSTAQFALCFSLFPVEAGYSIMAKVTGCQLQNYLFKLHVFIILTLEAT